MRTRQRRTDSADSPVRVFRRDRAQMLPGERTPEGYLRVHAMIAKPGVMEYQNADGTYGMCSVYSTLEPAPVLLLDGAYSTRPELADLVDFSLLVDAPIAVRHARLARREEPRFLAALHARWDEAEAYYFTYVRPPSTFDWILSAG